MFTIAWTSECGHESCRGWHGAESESSGKVEKVAKRGPTGSNTKVSKEATASDTPSTEAYRDAPLAVTRKESAKAIDTPATGAYRDAPLAVTRKESRRGRWRGKEVLSGSFMKADSALCQLGRDEPNSKWEPLPITVDSGAAESVMPEGLCSQYETMDTKASLSGMCYLGADGSEIPNLGDRTICALMEDGSAARMRFQVCPVTKALASVSRMTQAGNKVVFDSEDSSEGSYIENKYTGMRTYLRQENGVYMLDAWAMPAGRGKGRGQGFQRQGV